MSRLRTEGPCGGAERDIAITVLPDGGLRFEGADGHWYGTTYPRQLTLTG